MSFSSNIELYNHRQTKRNGVIEMSEQNGVSILVIDDEEVIRDLIRDVIERDKNMSQLNPIVEFAETGEEGLRKIQESECDSSAKMFDIIICDLRMPGMNGVETIKAIRKGGIFYKAMFMTGNAHEKVIEQARVLTTIPLIEKPFNVYDFTKALHLALTN
ncbi:response regulator [Patescibacteria group bacterium]|nr:response regulator [Patescibacteria group bacterium]